MTNWKVPLADIDLGEEEIQAVNTVLRSRWLSMGPVTAEFERCFAEYLGVRYAFAVTNCTVALHLAHLALGAGPGDTVLCPSLTFVATANAICYTGATPVFVDITGTEDFNLSPEDIEARIDASTRGICVMHYGGYPCDMERIMQIARRHDLYVVEDAAHAPGAACWMPLQSGKEKEPAERVLQKCGTIGDIGCFSFFANKNMTTAEGGMITTNNPELAERIQRLRSHGMTSLTWDREQGHGFSYDVVALGYNYRLDELRAALGLVQLGKLPALTQRRVEITLAYREKLDGLPGLSLPFRHLPHLAAYHIFPILLDRDLDRHAFMQFMKAQGIQTSIHYPPIHRFTHYAAMGYGGERLPHTEDIADRVVTLPLYPQMGRSQVDYVAAAVTEWIVTNTSSAS